ncbi:MAG: single-stranded-DNA-specific exonuclease RecJ [Oscillospiraceae bacterium]
MAFKKWNILKQDKEMSKILADECGVAEFVASILVNRGHTTYEDAMQFLTLGDSFASPFDIKDMKKASGRIKQAVDDFEKIYIYGDYDCDGVTSTAVMYTYLSSIGADVYYYIPERDGEGYGMNKTALKQIHDDGASLVITVDNGISAIDEAIYASELGLELIITDHHQPGTVLPQAFAIVNPHRQDDLSDFKFLAGVGVAFKLIAAMEDGDYNTALESFADIVAIGTIGDIVPLIEENRSIVKHGLQSLKISNNIGLLALTQVAGINLHKITAQTVAFSIVPRINAAGRMGSAGLAVQLLLCEDHEEALEIAMKMDSLNKERQAKEQEIIKDIEDMMSKDKTLLTSRVIMLKKDDWNHGIIGIACSKLIERYGKPVMLMTLENGMLKGSARSIGEFHLFKALSANASFLQKFGGHKLAAGFSLKEEDFDAFRQGVEDYACQYHDMMPQSTLNIDKELSPKELTVEQINELSYLEPFGSRNEPPLFLIKNAILNSTTPLSEDKHQRINITVDGVSVNALYFGMSSDRFFYEKGAIVDVVVNADINVYNDKESVSLKIKDIRPSGFSQEKFFVAKNYFEKIKRCEGVSKNIIVHSTPTRDEIAIVYKLLKANNGYNNDIDCLYLQLLGSDINYCKLRIILDILDEVGLIVLSPSLNNIKICEVTGKVDLSSSLLLQRLTK